ncbi:MAG TPA: hypothetical protein VK845_00165 [Gemmatimonadales bacterium]|nr:hypothetical protein [Gemmatimonadales bacterium]
MAAWPIREEDERLASPAYTRRILKWLRRIVITGAIAFLLFVGWLVLIVLISTP